MRMIKFIKRWVLLIILILGLFSFFYFDLQKYLTFTELKKHREWLLTWTNQHYFIAVISYISIYIVVVALSIPGAIFLTLVGGFLFGLIGTLYVVVSATLGALCIFLAVRLALEPFIAKGVNKWVGKMRKGFQENALQYLLVLRLIPLFPFWVVNIASALLGVRTFTFVIGTFFGIIPGSFITVLLGNGLGQLLDQGKTPDLGIFFEPQILIPLIALALLSCLSIFYKRTKRKQ